MVIVCGSWGREIKIGDKIPLRWHPIEDRELDQPAVVIGFSNKHEYVKFWNFHPKALAGPGPIFLKVLID